MAWLSALGYGLWALIVLLACAICYASTRPGQRRRKQDKSYCGPERRHDPTVRDFFDQPMFTRPSCNACDKINPTSEKCEHNCSPNQHGHHV